MQTIQVPTRGQLRAWNDVRSFLLAGNAYFTLRSMKTGARFTYRVRVKKQDVEENSTDPAFFVSWLRGPDNGNDYAYLGVLRRDYGLRLTAASRATREAPCVKALVWFLDALKNGHAVLGDAVEFWHEGKCCRCGRRLTVPESVQDGVGPECSGKLKLAA